jgi:hypothetical protein
MIKIQTHGIFKNIFVIIFSIFLSITSISMANAQQSGEANNAEKTIIIKGLYIGMDVDEAKKIMEQLVGKDWVVSSIDLTDKIVADYRFVGGEERIFGGEGTRKITYPPMTGDRGFAIQDKKSQSYHGYISTDISNKVIRISLGGKLVDYIFAAKEIGVEDFVEEFAKSYNLPAFNWIPYGWIYISENKGYTLRIMIDKVMDLKKDQDKNNSNNPKFKFN